MDSTAVVVEHATPIQFAGAFCFGLLIGWFVYYVNRWRKADVGFGDLVTLVGVIGGGAVLAIFPAKSEMFGAYGIGLAIGFFGYLGFLMVLVAQSPDFRFDWFLDGRRQAPHDGEIIIGGGEVQHPMEASRVKINP